MATNRRQVSISSHNSNASKDGSTAASQQPARPSSASANKQPQKRIELNESDFDSSSSSDEEDSSDSEVKKKKGSAAIGKGTVQGGMLGGDDSSSSSSSDDSSENEEGAPPSRPRSASNSTSHNRHQPQQQSSHPPVRPNSASANNRQPATAPTTQPTQPTSKPVTTTKSAPAWTKPSVTRENSEFNYGNYKPEPKPQPQPQPQPQPPSQQQSSSSHRPTSGGSTTSSTATTNSNSAAAPKPAPATENAGITIIPPPLNVNLPGILDLCEYCDEHQARIFCVDCSIKLCYGTGPDGSIKGCAIEMHKNPTRQGHKRCEWTATGRGRLVNFDALKPSSPTAEKTSNATSTTTATAGPSTAVSQPPPQQQHSQPQQQQPLINPPPLTTANGGPETCELCDDYEARVFCEECNMKLCWGTTNSGNFNGCVIDMHRNTERIHHHRYDWSVSKGKGQLIPFQKQLPSEHQTPKPQPQPQTATQPPSQSQSDQQQAPPRHHAAPLPPVTEHGKSAGVRNRGHGHHSPAPTASTSSSSSNDSTSSSNPLLTSILSDPTAWTPLQVCHWLVTLQTSFFSLQPIFLAHGISGSMLLALTDDQLRRDLQLADQTIRRKILDGVAGLQLKSQTMVGSTASVSATGRPFSTELLSATRATLEARGFDSTEDEEVGVESKASQSIPYTRAQLMFLLGERNRLVTQLADENQQLRQQLAQLQHQPRSR